MHHCCCIFRSAFHLCRWSGQLSPEVGVFRYLQEVVVYAFTNKFAYKFAACLFLGLGGSFVSGMISYGKQAKMRKRARATRVQFQSQPESKKSGMSKTA